MRDGLNHLPRLTFKKSVRFKDGSDNLSESSQTVTKVSSVSMCAVDKDKVVQSPFRGNPRAKTKSLSSGNNIFSALVTCKVNECKTHALIDSGSQVTVISLKLYESLMNKPELTGKYLLQGIDRNMCAEAWRAKGIYLAFKDCVYVWDVLVADISDAVIIGTDFMCHFGANLNF